MDEMTNSKADADVSHNANATQPENASSESMLTKAKTPESDASASKDLVGHAIIEFGKSLRNMAIFLLILDVIGSLIFCVIIPIYTKNHYDRYGMDLYNTVSRGLAMNVANTDSALFYMSGLLINITLFALTIGRGIYSIGMARIRQHVSGSTIEVELNDNSDKRACPHCGTMMFKTASWCSNCRNNV